tara:strand:- start:7112 stop:8281 length:1170 start_codon:yes stop_codon:yes gene_type:complete
MSAKKSAKARDPEVKNDIDYKNVDLLDEDKPIAGQKYVCLSFVSPEDILKDKNLFYFEKFIKHFDFKKSMDKYTQFLNFLSYKYSLDFQKISKDLEEFIIEEKEKLIDTTIEDDYKSYIDNSEKKLQQEFSELHNYQTNTRGIKIRGTFGSQEEAEQKCKMLREYDPNHDVYVGQVGLWMPFHPEAYKTGKVEYLEKELNELMYKKKENDEVNKDEFNKRVKDAKRKAIEENIAKATKEGNKLMQSIDEDGNLINADRMDVPGKNLLFGGGENDDVSTADLRRELFNGENIILDKDNDHGIGEILERKKNKEVSETDVAKTDVAKTDVAETEAAETDVAETEAAETDVDETDVAETDVPETNVDETDVDETDVTETDVTETDVPETDVD